MVAKALSLLRSVRGTSDAEEDAWKYRRLLVFGIILWCMTLITYVVWKGNQGTLQETTIYALSGILMGVIGSYVFGAVWDDKSIRQSEVEMAAVKEGTPATQVVAEKATVTGAPVTVEPAGPPPGFAG